MTKYGTAIKIYFSSLKKTIMLRVQYRVNENKSMGKRETCILIRVRQNNTDVSLSKNKSQSFSNRNVKRIVVGGGERMCTLN